MEEQTEKILDTALSIVSQDGDKAQVVLMDISPKTNVTTAPAAIGLALNRTKRDSQSSHSSRGHSDMERRDIKTKALYIDAGKSTDDSDGDSDNRMVIQSSDSEKEATVNDERDDVQSNQNGATKNLTNKRKASCDAGSDDEEFCGFTVEEQCI